MNQNEMQKLEELLESDQNDAEIQYQIGLCYLNGSGAEQDGEKAETWLRRAAEQGHAGAQEILQSVQKQEAAKLEALSEETLPDWCLAAEEGNLEAQYQVGKLFLEQSDTEEDGIRYLTMAIEQGSPQACLQLAEHLMHEEKYSKAIPLLQNAADCGLEKAAYWLGWCYVHGKGVLQDPNRAEKYLVQAAKVGGAEAMLDLAVRYSVGDGLPPKPSVAFAWLKKAQDAGAERAQERFEERRRAFYEQQEARQREKEQIQANEYQQQEEMQQDTLPQEEQRQAKQQETQQRDARRWKASDQQRRETLHTEQAHLREVSLQQEKMRQQKEREWREEFQKQENTRKEEQARQQEEAHRQKEETHRQEELRQQKLQEEREKAGILERDRAKKPRLCQTLGLLGPVVVILMVLQAENVFFLGDILSFCWDFLAHALLLSNATQDILTLIGMFIIVLAFILSPTLLFWGAKKMREYDCQQWFFGLKRNYVVLIGLVLFVLANLLFVYALEWDFNGFVQTALQVVVLGFINRFVMMWRGIDVAL